ncbi:hypothetical protein NKH95_27610 [Mesorhizobium sp. M0848]|uniref:hypothetical protein n=1 Tax=Mesorhizobium sp. M0848 TaxID=2957012 RepID=UPI00333B5F9D
MIPLSNNDQTTHLPCGGNFGWQETEILTALSSVNSFYPGFSQWFRGRVIGEIDGPARRIFVSRDQCSINGVAIAKRGAEAKLCTLWVSPIGRHSGVARSLASDVFDWIGTEKPLFTVPEERLDEFRGLLRLWDFGQPQRMLGYYRPGKIEYIFNGSGNLNLPV